MEKVTEIKEKLSNIIFGSQPPYFVNMIGITNEGILVGTLSAEGKKAVESLLTDGKYEGILVTVEIGSVIRAL